MLHRILPIIRDRQADRGLRIRAIRELGRVGFVLGGDTLIELLREGGGIAKVEVLWALTQVSGMAWGDEPDRWQAWWDDLPMTLKDTQSDTSESESAVSLSEG